jgi:hypothetical protein
MESKILMMRRVCSLLWVLRLFRVSTKVENVVVVKDVQVSVDVEDVLEKDDELGQEMMAK